MPGLTIPGGFEIRGEELRFEFVRGGGPGGQNVNKVATRAVLRFDLLRSTSLSPEVRARAAAALATRLTRAGELVLSASEHRTQAANRRAALERLRRLLADAVRPPTPRRATRPTSASVRRRVAEKRRRSLRKRERRGAVEE